MRFTVNRSGNRRF